MSADLSADEAELVAGLVRGLVVPSLIEDEAATAEARETARQNVDPVQQSVAKDQLIVESGQRIDATTPKC